MASKTLLGLLMVLGCVSALGSHKSMRSTGQLFNNMEKNRELREYYESLERAPGLSGPVNRTFFTRVDHFNGSNWAKWDMQYIIDEDNYNPESGPILFYAGNEGGVWNFYNNSGFITKTLAKEMGAMVIFAEHRFYGESMPFGDKTFDKENLRFIAVEQVMWDYIELLKDIKTSFPELENRATIAFGGSYGGMLASWMRMKYPTHIQGALAASAPILWFEGKTDPNAYTRIASDVIKEMGGQECYDSMQRGFFDLKNMVNDKSKLAELNKIFNPCTDMTKSADVEDLIGFISDTIGTTAMVNYPYPTEFIGTLPAWPINETCNAIKNYTYPEPSTDDEPVVSLFNFTHISQLQAALNLTTNYTGDLTCLKLEQTGALDDNGWDIQTCGEFPMPQGDGPAQSCFTWQNWDKAAHTSHCEESYGLTPKYDWALDYFGGRNPPKDFAAASNIIFSNGAYDPWHAGGITANITENTIALYIEKSAHHLDLREPNDADPWTLTEARAVEMAHIKKWVQDYQGMEL